MNSISQNLQSVITRIATITPLQSRTPTLIAVSKTQSAAVVAQTIALGHINFGENYVQEGVDKIIQLKSMAIQSTIKPLIWHMIGSVQSNKTRLVAEHFDWIHTIDRLKIAQRLSEQRPEGLLPLQVLIQINIDGESSKGGVLPHEALLLAQALVLLPRLKLRGLMCIPEKNTILGFERMNLLYQQLKQAGLIIDVLSMGMSNDFESAILHGATHVRVGTAIFGTRV